MTARTLGQKDNADGNTELGGDDETKEEGKDGREQRADTEPELGSQLSHGEKEGDKGQVHGNVTEEHNDNVESLGVLEEVEELSPGIVGPLDNAVLGVDLGSLHDPCLLLTAVLCLSLDGILAGNLLGSSKELGTLSIRKRVGEDAILRIGGERVLGRGKRRNGQVLRNRNMAGSRSSAGRFG
ncbi:hypothetical protein HG531_008519 [Fusarium graminearum]|nr:hypothetical protein HG531_008519 [Fusarium graminearum]